MKTPKILLIFILLVLNSCSSDDSSDSSKSKFAMTAKVDGALWEMQNPYGSDYATNTLFEMYPEEEYILLAGRINFMDEIRLYIKRSDLKVGTYPITKATFDASKTQVEMSYNTKATAGIQYPVEGSLSVTSVDLNAKRVQGTFSFNCVEDDSEPISASNPVTTRVTEGTFNYKYDFDYK